MYLFARPLLLFLSCLFDFSERLSFGLIDLIIYF